MLRKSSLIGLVLLFAAAPAASAAVLVLGAGPARTCYLESKAGKPSRDGLEACGEALERSALSMRDRAATHVNRSVLLLAERRTGEALADTEAALAIIPDLAGATVNRSAALIRLDRFAEAREILDDALPGAHGQDLISGLFNRAVASEALGDVKSAYADFRRAVQLDPEFEQAKLELTRYRVTSK